MANERDCRLSYCTSKCYNPLKCSRLHQDAAAQPGGARHSARGDAAEHELDPAAQHQVSPGHAALPLLSLLPGLPGAAHLPLQVTLPGGEGGLRGEDAGLRLPLASHAGL